MTNNEAKNDIMLLTLSRFGSIPGKKALQKIMYFANLKANIYSFQWNKYGPYSEELKYVLDDAILMGIIDVNQVDLQTKEGKQFNMKLSEEGLASMKSRTMDELTTSSVEFAYKLLNNKSPRQMELLASVHYIMSHSDIKIDPKFVYNLLRHLKPDAGFKMDDVTGIMDELTVQNLAQKVGTS